MISAEQWYEYQESYKRYGLDMKPKKRQVTEVKARPASIINTRDKISLFALVIVLGVICIGTILTTSYCAKIQYSTNKVVKANEELQGEIENLNVQIKTAMSLESLEYKGVNQLGMVAPTDEQYVVIAQE